MVQRSRFLFTWYVLYSALYAWCMVHGIKSILNHNFVHIVYIYIYIYINIYAKQTISATSLQSDGAKKTQKFKNSKKGKGTTCPKKSKNSKSAKGPRRTVFEFSGFRVFVAPFCFWICTLQMGNHQTKKGMYEWQNHKAYFISIWNMYDLKMKAFIKWQPCFGSSA